MADSDKFHIGIVKHFVTELQLFYHSIERSLIVIDTERKTDSRGLYEACFYLISCQDKKYRAKTLLVGMAIDMLFTGDGASKLIAAMRKMRVSEKAIAVSACNAEADGICGRRL